MKVKQGKTVPIPECDREGWQVMAARTQDLLVLDCFVDKEYKGRYLMNIETKEYGMLRDGVYSAEKLVRAFSGELWNEYRDCRKIGCTVEDREFIKSTLGINTTLHDDAILYKICDIEGNYLRDKSWAKEDRRQERIRKLMSTVPELSEDFRKWAAGIVWKDPYPTYERADGEYRCPACDAEIEIKRNGKILPHNTLITCSECGKKLTLKRRGKRTEKWDQVMCIQESTEGQALYRHFDIKTIFDDHGHRINLSEAFRIFIEKSKPLGRKGLQIYFNQYGKNRDSDDFDTKDPANKRVNPCYLYPKGIEALKGTDFRKLERLFEQMAAAEVRADYNSIMIVRNDPDILAMVEYLFKGHFYRLMAEETKHISIHGYYGKLNPAGLTIEQVMGLKDRQKINRLRAMDGGYTELEWFRRADKTGEKLSEKFMEFVQAEELGIVYTKFIADKMTPEQIMNYVFKQRETGYKRKSAKSILNQWEDYLSMSKRLGKDVTDEMVYRPRELKRRHDEAVEAIRRIEMIAAMKRDAKEKEKRAKELRERYPGAEEILAEIAPRYEYENSEYKIIVPRNLTDIMTEGNALHHCVGSTDRYFERIRDQETYICFLRRQSAPDLPYYTIEVEPGGTIRQHRGMYDEEPNIGEIRGFLREWQKILKKRLHSKDWQLAEESRIKREKNLEQLRKANNERVLKGLAEDFMEAV